MKKAKGLPLRITVQELVHAWLVMLVIGTFHAHYASVPHPGYWLSLLGVWAVEGVISLGVASGLYMAAE